jgi:heme oxygenase
MKSLVRLINGGRKVSQNSKTFYLFNMINGKKKLAYGDNVEDALEILSMRLTENEMNQIIKTEYVKVPQVDLQKVVKDLG